jgi:DNA-binding MarR family transcriptional regulator
MHLTTKQIDIMRVIVAGDGRDAGGNLIPVDLDQLLERLQYATTKASIQFSIRALIKHNLIYKAGTETRRGRLRVRLAPTERGKATISASPSMSIIEPEPLVAAASLEPF